jgi:transketolase C-terminal domain/subunit
MYPLNMQLIGPNGGFAVANDAKEHQAMTDMGYRPHGAIADAEIPAPAPIVQSTREGLMAQADALGLKVDKRWSDTRLAEEIARA